MLQEANLGGLSFDIGADQKRFNRDIKSAMKTAEKGGRKMKQSLAVGPSADGGGALGTLGAVLGAGKIEAGAKATRGIFEGISGIIDGNLDQLSAASDILRNIPAIGAAGGALGDLIGSLVHGIGSEEVKTLEQIKDAMVERRELARATTDEEREAIIVAKERSELESKITKIASVAKGQAKDAANVVLEITRKTFDLEQENRDKAKKAKQDEAKKAEEDRRKAEFARRFGSAEGIASRQAFTRSNNPAARVGNGDDIGILRRMVFEDMRTRGAVPTAANSPATPDTAFGSMMSRLLAKIERNTRVPAVPRAT